MTKFYKSKSRLSISLVFENGTRKHISFEAKTGGGSTYSSDNIDEQKALESHPYFGKMFSEFVPPQPKRVEKSPSSNIGGVITVTVTDIVEAKNYLADRFGISRTKLRSKQAILDAAVENKIRFEGINEDENTQAEQ